MIYFGYPLDIHGWKPKPETEPETKSKPEPENRGRKTNTKPETRNRNPNLNPKPIRVEIHHQNQTRGYPKPEWIPETRMDIRNPRINIHIFTCINKRQQIINIFMSQLSINLIV